MKAEPEMLKGKPTDHNTVRQSIHTTGTEQK